MARVAVLARSEDRSLDFGTARDDHLSVLHKSEVLIKCSSLAFSCSAYDTVTVCGVGRHTHLAAGDDDGGKSSVLIISLADGGHVAAAKHVAHHVSAHDGDVGVAVHLASGGAIVLLTIRASIGIQAATAAIHVAVEHVCAQCFFANQSVLDVHLRVLAHMAVFAAAKHRTLHMGTLSDGHFGILHVCKFAVFNTCYALAAAIHVASKLA